MNPKDLLRTLFCFRKIRRTPAAGEKPPVGSNIVMGKLRIFLKHPIDYEQWEWFTLMGWRTIDMRTNRRQYIIVPDKVVLGLISADERERDMLHTRRIKVIDTKWRRSRNGH